MAALDARHVDEARRTPEQRSAGKRQLGHRLIPAFGNGACPVGDTLAALENAADAGMRFEALELIEW